LTNSSAWKKEKKHPGKKRKHAGGVNILNLADDERGKIGLLPPKAEREGGKKKKNGNYVPVLRFDGRGKKKGRKKTNNGGKGKRRRKGNEPEQ